MASESSGDELASYEHVPQSATSKLVAGPSNKRKNALASTHSTGKKLDPAEAISVSSDEDTIHPVSKRGRVATGQGSTTNGRSVSSRGKGKAVTGAPVRRRKVGVEEESTAEDGGVSRVAVKSVTGDGKGRNLERLHSQLAHLQKKLDDVTQQRDRMSGHLDEGFRLRENETEKLMHDQKAQYEARLKAQDDTIQELQASLSRVDALSRSSGSTSLHFLTRETADEEKQDVQREVSMLKKTIKEKDKTINEKEINIKKLDDTIQVLRADLKAEIENTKALTSRNPPSSSSKHSSKSLDPKLALVIRLYEEMTNVLITNVRHEPGQYKEDDAVYTCVQTTSNNKSLNFTLKIFQEAESGETPTKAKRSGQIVEKVIYTPQLLEQETPEFITQLDFLAGPFIFQKTQLSVFTNTLTSYLEGENQDNPSDLSQMEVEEG